ncbi:MAG TPA: nuclear transport factor 2 family protein [Chloroflexota bacterium]|nr:nuclear transport factor 2 family protein [Chloroflexota bacterium]
MNKIISPSVALLILALAACSAAAPARTIPTATADPTAEIVAALDASTEAWNAGELEGFLEPYLDSPGTTFVGGSGLLRGKDAIRESYRRSYWRTGTPEDRLSFQEIEVRPLGPEHALAVGRYVVARRATGEQTATGLFSLVLVRTAQGWRILHDHSS